jgi:IclR family acetate operon transcriptional repressor
MTEIRSLARGLQIIQKMADSPDGVSITDLADEFGVDKGSISRLLQTLTSYGFAEKDPNSRRFILGPQIVRLSRLVLTRMPLRETAKPFLRQLVEATGECAHLAILAQGKALYIDQVESEAVLRVTTGVGTLAPLYCTALGKVLLAFGAGPIPAEMQAYTLRTITDPILLQHHLEQVRAQKVGIDDEEYTHGVRCIAVPVYDFRDKCVAAIGISGPVSRLTLEKMPQMIQITQEIGDALSARLSFRADDRPRTTEDG